ncbi:hypothetical protein ATANTOWER_012134 [Ataeniobius toweri]|uniref:Uncharacterized protein n=1 Tax=Ataeniobius toweri TaxID=208326 RepID=A0ABU7C169_9TELE|nr:hypothetical protein [Ataeniobius toweri]
MVTVEELQGSTAQVRECVDRTVFIRALNKSGLYGRGARRKLSLKAKRSPVYGFYKCRRRWQTSGRTCSDLMTPKLELFGCSGKRTLPIVLNTPVMVGSYMRVFSRNSDAGES